VGSIIVPLTSCLTGLGQSVLNIKTKIVSYHTAESKPVKQEVNGTVILPPLVFPAYTIKTSWVRNVWIHSKLLFVHVSVFVFVIDDKSLKITMKYVIFL